MLPSAILLILLTGVVAGVLSGLMGIGGGLITTPAIRLVLGYPAITAVATPLVPMIPTTLAAMWEFSRHGNVDLKAALVLGAVAAPAAVAGAWLTVYVGGSTILVLTSVILVWTASGLVLGAPRVPVPGERHRERLVVLGVAAGLFSGFFGLGGGSIIVPGLVRWLGKPMREALGTSLVAIAMIAVPGLITHAVLGHVDWRLGGLLVVGVVPGAAAGSALAHLGGERWLRLLFAGFLIAVAGALAAGELAGLR